MMDFSNWEIYEGLAEGSGRSEKLWLKNPTDNTIGLFKYTRSENTTEHISEKIAELIAAKIGLKCACIDIGTYQGRVGCMSYLINTGNESLIEGVALITKYHPSYDLDKLFDLETNEYYSIEMIFEAVSEYNLQDDLIKIMIFDSIIGNSDRHHSNWAILQNGINTKICPLYDNGSSLCFCLPEMQVLSYLGKDKNRFNSLVDTKSKSMIRIDKYDKKHPTHSSVLQYISARYMTTELIRWVELIVDKLDNITVNDIVSGFIGHGYNSDKAELVSRFITGKVSIIKEIFLGKEE